MIEGGMIEFAPGIHLNKTILDAACTMVACRQRMIFPKNEVERYKVIEDIFNTYLKLMEEARRD